MLDALTDPMIRDTLTGLAGIVLGPLACVAIGYLAKVLP